MSGLREQGVVLKLERHAQAIDFKNLRRRLDERRPPPPNLRNERSQIPARPRAQRHGHEERIERRDAGPVHAELGLLERADDDGHRRARF